MGLVFLMFALGKCDAVFFLSFYFATRGFGFVKGWRFVRNRVKVVGAVSARKKLDPKAAWCLRHGCARATDFCCLNSSYPRTINLAFEGIVRSIRPLLWKGTLQLKTSI